MAEDKQFDASPTKIKKAKKEGNIPMSPELNTIAQLGIGGFTALAVIPMIGGAAAGWIKGAAMSNPTDAASALTIALWTCVPCFIIALAGVSMTILQQGGPTFVALKVKFDKMKPADGFKRMFGMEAAVNGARALLAFAVAIMALVGTVNELFARATTGASPPAFATLAISGATRALQVCLAVGGVFALFDVLVVRKRWAKKLKMDFEEMKREFKESEGDPHTKGKRKQFARALLRGSRKRIVDAAFVVANPTHVAIVLQYAPPQISVPIVLIMATEEEALDIRREAAERNIPIVENITLARELLATAEVGEMIPRESFIAVAEIVSALSRAGLIAA